MAKIFCLMETIFFHLYFFETVLAIRGNPIFLKNVIPACRNRILQFFSDTNSNGSSFLVQLNCVFQRMLHSG